MKKKYNFLQKKSDYPLIYPLYLSLWGGHIRDYLFNHFDFLFIQPFIEQALAREALGPTWFLIIGELDEEQEKQFFQKWFHHPQFKKLIWINVLMIDYPWNNKLRNEQKFRDIKIDWVVDRMPWDLKSWWSELLIKNKDIYAP